MLKIFQRKRKDPKDELRELLNGYELPSFPGVVMKLLSLLRERDCQLSEIAAQVELDPGLQIKVLRSVNSAAIGLAHEVSSVQQAASLLGRSRLEALVLSVAVRGNVHAPASGFDMNRFWLSAARRGALARSLAKRFHPTTQAEAFTAGFLQDLAVPIIASRQGAKYKELYDHWIRNGTSLDELEREAFGYDHTSIGSLMAEDWKLPEYLARAISGHHAPTEPAVDPSSSLVAMIRDCAEVGDLSEFIAACAKQFDTEESVLSPLIDQALEDARGFHRALA